MGVIHAEEADFNDSFDDGTPIQHRYFRVSMISLFVGIILITGLTATREDIAQALGVHRPMTMLEHSGGVLLNVSQLKDHISLPMHAGHHRYWLGATAGDTYTTNCVTPGVLKVDYFGPNQSLNAISQPIIRVTAYQSLSVYNGRLRPLGAQSPALMSNSRGDSVEINMSSLNRIVVFPKFSQEVITINYSSPQLVASMIRDSESLVAL